MASYSEIKGKCSRSKYAAGGRVAGRNGNPSKTVINIVVPPSAPGGMPGAGAAPAPAAPQNSPSGGTPVPPAAAAMALNAMQGKPGAPGAFANGGRIAPKPAATAKKAGAGGARGRLQKAGAAKSRGKRPGEQIR